MVSIRKAQTPSFPTFFAEEHRIDPRAPTRGAVAYLSEHRVCIARAGDVSLGGAFVATHNPDAVGTRATVRFQNLNRSMVIEAEVVRVVFSTGPNGEPPGMGLKFSELSDEQMSFLASYLAPSVAASVERGV